MLSNCSIARSRWPADSTLSLPWRGMDIDLTPPWPRRRAHGRTGPRRVRPRSRRSPSRETASVPPSRAAAASVPLSRPAAALVAQRTVGIDTLITGGDDYEILCTVPEASVEEIGRAHV